MLPHEQENIAEIDERFRAHFEICRRLIAYTSRPFLHELQTAVASERTLTRKVAIGLVVRETRRFRAVVAMCQLGLVENAQVLARTLFEGLLAERFVFGRERPLKWCSRQLQTARARLPDIPKGWKKRDFRAALYSAHQTIRLNKSGTRSKSIVGMKRLLTKSVTKGVNQKLVLIESTIGADWYKTLSRSPGTYSGLKIREQAENYSQLKLYETVYSLQSVKSHASDIEQYTGFDDETNAFVANIALVNESALQQVLQLSAALTLQIARDLAVSHKLEMESSLDDLVLCIAALAT